MTTKRGLGTHDAVAKKKVPARRVAARPSAAVIQVHERLTRLESMMETQVETSKSLTESLDHIKSSLQRDRGFWGALTLIGGAIAAFLGFIKEPLFKKFGIS